VTSIYNVDTYVRVRAVGTCTCKKEVQKVEEGDSNRKRGGSKRKRENSNGRMVNISVSKHTRVETNSGFSLCIGQGSA